MINIRTGILTNWRNVLVFKIFAKDLVYFGLLRHGADNAQHGMAWHDLH